MTSAVAWRSDVQSKGGIRRCVAVPGFRTSGARRLGAPWANEHELKAAEEEACQLALGWDPPDETDGLSEAIDAMWDPDDPDALGDPDLDPDYPDEDYIRNLAKAEGEARERLEAAEWSAALASSGSVEERYAGYSAAAEEWEGYQRRLRRCRARRRLHVVETEFAQRLLAARGQLPRSSGSPHCRASRLPRRAGLARARRSRRVSHVKKTAAGDSGDPDPEPPTIRRHLDCGVALSTLGTAGQVVRAEGDATCVTPAALGRDLRSRLLEVVSPVEGRHRFSTRNPKDSRAGSTALRPFRPGPACRGVLGRMKDVASSLPWPEQVLAGIPEKLRRAAPRPGRYSALARSAGQLGGINRCTHAMLAAESVFIAELQLARMTMWSRTTLQAMRRDGGESPFSWPGRRIVSRPAHLERRINQRTTSDERCPACPNHLGGPRP